MSLGMAGSKRMQASRGTHGNRYSMLLWHVFIDSFICLLPQSKYFTHASLVAKPRERLPWSGHESSLVTSAVRCSPLSGRCNDAMAFTIDGCLLAKTHSLYRTHTHHIYTHTHHIYTHIHVALDHYCYFTKE